VLIAVDEDIPFAAEAFAHFGDVRALPARGITAVALRDAEALVVRSVTRVSAELLEGSRMRFIGTATAGVDHVDLPYLKQQGIAFADALGANANAVAEYVVAALLNLRDSGDLDLSRSTLGIVGFGHVGRKVARYAAALGLRIVVNDPPLARSTCELLYRPIEEIFDCDVVTLHVPLERGGTDPTYHLVDDTFLAAMKPGAFLINTSRGAVGDTAALRRTLDAGRLGGLVMDVWENEPAIDAELAETCRIATAHIAGHTLDAKIAAVEKLVKAFTTLQKTNAHRVGPEECGADPLPCDSLSSAVRGAFDIVGADHRLRQTLGLPGPSRAVAFDTLRAGWPVRREFHVRPIIHDAGDRTDMSLFRTLGFRTAALAGGVGR